MDLGIGRWAGALPSADARSLVPFLLRSHRLHVLKYHCLFVYSLAVSAQSAARREEIVHWWQNGACRVRPEGISEQL